MKRAGNGKRAKRRTGDGGGYPETESGYGGRPLTF